MIKSLIKKIIFGYRASSESYIEYLREHGAKMGDNITLWAPHNTVLDISNPYLLEIGDYVNITYGCIILTHDYSLSVLKHKYGEVLGCSRKTIVGNNVFIGNNTIILCGSVVGNNVIIGAGSVVAGTLESNAVYAGVPAKKICSIEEYYQKRKARQYEEASQLWQGYYLRFHQEPSEKIFHEYFFLFAKRELTSLHPDFQRVLHLGGEYEKTKGAFLSSVGKFESFPIFCEHMRKKYNN